VTLQQDVASSERHRLLAFPGTRSTIGWQFYNSAKQSLCDGTFDLDNDAFRMSLYTSKSNAATLTLSTIDEVTAEVTTGGYTPKPMVTRWLADIADPAKMNFEADDVLATGDMLDVRYAAIWALVSHRLLCCYQTQCLAILPTARPSTLFVRLQCLV
jgi:hypothetical protein